MKIIKPQFGTIWRILILESVERGSILYKLDADSKISWKINSKGRIFYDLFVEGEKIKIADGSGEADLNPDTGEIKNWVLTK